MTQFKLRDYQIKAVQATLSHFRTSLTPAAIVLPTGAGKSLVIAELSRLAKGRVLCLAHVKELVEQNHSKFEMTGRKAGIFSAGLGEKCSSAQVTFASVQSLAPNLDKFSEKVSLLIIDECHRISDNTDTQYQQVIQHLQTMNPSIKILGLTATPFRLGSGWIYEQHYYGFVRSAETKFFKKCIYELPLRQMIKEGYLTKPILFDAAIAHYDFSKLEANSIANEETTNQEKSLNTLIGKYPRVTQAIVEQIIALSQDRQGIMIFASTVQHAQEITQYIENQDPDNEVKLVHGGTPLSQRDDIIQQFKAKSIKYLVNVSVLTTGFDAPHVDVIAILRPTQSISLFQQIVGRGLRLSDNKQDCLILDYANNGYDLFMPEIGEKKPTSDSIPVQVECPICEFANVFWGKVDNDGDIIEHFGRRCHGLVPNTLSRSTHLRQSFETGEVQCDYRFRFKVCPLCNEENDIAARHCQACEGRLIDPDDLLKKALNLKDSKVIRCAGMESSIKQSILSVRYFDEDGNDLKEHFDFSKKAALVRFNEYFARRLAQGTRPISFNHIDEVKPFLVFLPHPDFVIARKKGQFWKVTERLFDYEGPYRKANQLN
ncbi:DEAD/DEAH box helicase [Marinomonas sp. 15G1-11]|uniref:DEAD/DEAH box helicase n=1 Tax=Marinomonas phaeophyticola TaxID=3004091 RepID=A0ABT4JVB9_9GAMM|nr:DEAD/DEAH box helicase [Marinomonas sp. 15G1-11]MCZ2722285.1 DEAD/DEAH box helicase [Marinomonas sp. 15G1-11]